MVRLRLRRVGRKKQPSYRLVAADKEAPRDGRFLEVVGFYNPRTEPSTIKLKEDRIFHWLSHGAQPSDAADSLFRQMGTWDRYERFKAGEKIEKLLEEAAQVEASRDVSPKTRHDTLPTGKAKKAAPAPAAEKPKEAAPKETPAKEPVKEEKSAKEPKAEKAETKAAAEEKTVEKSKEEKVETKAAVEEKAAEEPKPKAKAKAKTKAKTKTEAKTKAKAKTKTKAKTKSKTKAKAKTKTKAKSKTTKKTDKKK